METSKPLMKDKNAEDVYVHLYKSMIGSLIYLTSSRPDIIYLKGQPKLGLWYPKDSPFDLEAYTDSDYAGASLDKKSTTGGCQFHGSRLISWQCKKQTIVSNSTTEAEYVVTASCFKNPVFHSKTKHIKIRHHFIRDSNEKKLIQMIKIHRDQNVADLLTKAFNNGKAAKDEIQVSAVGLTFYWHTLTTANANGKVKTVNREVHIQALVDKKKVIITETSIRRDLQLADENGTKCLPNATIFVELERMGYENLTQKLTFYKAFFSPQ
ncbi:hypothetical protein Tco_1433210 [Tanacetum coccineum]